MTGASDNRDLWRTWRKRWVTNYVYIAAAIVVAYLIFGGMTQRSVIYITLIVILFAGFGYWDWRSMQKTGDPSKSAFASSRERNRS